jgi:glycosyltransferase involved in cell wall biosynthesis
MVRDMKLENVEFMGSIPQAELNACYRAADVFVCMSEHEGFCIPLIEALVQGVPVLAYAAAAVLARQAERIGEYKGLDLAGDLRRYLGPLLGR